MSTILESRLRDPAMLPISCPACKTPLEFKYPTPPPRSARIRCASPSCKRIFDPPSLPPPSSSSSTTASSKASAGNPPKQRRMGTASRPLETRYYDVLGVPVSADEGEIKKAYRRLAIKLHPDKCPDNPDAAELFNEISVAYQTLMDPDLRRKYNERGSAADQNGQDGFVDPEELFSTLFGGPKFEDMIGTISIGRTMKESLQAADAASGEEGSEGGGGGGGGGEDDETPRTVVDEKTGKRVVPPEEKERVAAVKRAKEEKARLERQARVDKLVSNLERKLSVFVEGVQGAAAGAGAGAGGEAEKLLGGEGEKERAETERLVGESFKTMCTLEASELALESYGPELLHAVGQTYHTRGSQHLAASSSAFGGLIGFFHGAKSGVNQFGETISLVRAGLHLKNVFEKLQAAEKLGLTPEQMKALEEEAAQEGLKTLWKSAKMEVESVIRETCDRLLTDPEATAEKRRLRAVGLELMGSAYLTAKKDAPDDDFVKVDTTASKARDGTSSGKA